VDGHRTAEAVTQARALLDGLRARPLYGRELALAAADLAGFLLQASQAYKTASDQANEDLLARLMRDDAGQIFSSLLADRAYRSRNAKRLVAELRWLLDALGVPRYLSATERLELGAVRVMGAAMPRAVAKGTLGRLRERTASVILSAEEPLLSRHLAQRRTAGLRLNLNRLGEAVLGEEEAERRVRQYAELLVRPDVEAVSIKVSTLTSQLDLVAWDATLERLRPRLRHLYRLARDHRFERADGRVVPKLVNLDMEAYRDLGLTVELFQSVLGESEFWGLTAGLALQAYLPDSFGIQQKLSAWARARVARGGVPMRLRIVKGANLAAEQVESSLRGWPLPTYGRKAEVDANFKRMLVYACRPEELGAVTLGVASHNVFDIAYALALCASRGVERGVSFELLEGMADPMRRVLEQLAGDVLVYGPVVAERDMQSAIAYLLRRLDENTSPENFLGHSFGMAVGDPAWHAERRKFLGACQEQTRVSRESRRRQNRTLPAAVASHDEFVNEPDTDFSRAVNRHWILGHLVRLEQRPPFRVALQVGGRLRYREPLADGFDPSRPGVVPYRYALGTQADIEVALRTATAARTPWQATSPADRSELLSRIAHGLRQSRGRLIAAMVLDAGKRIEEADAEVSEAIDFAEYYRRSFLEWTREREITVSAKGVALVTPPWNFPLAIAAGGSLAALMAGNAVLLKPAQETPWVAALFAAICWRAGVPKQVLQLVLCTDEVGSALVVDPRVNAVLLTGATATARRFHELRPGLDLLAETGGKNAMIVSGMADRDQAIHSAVRSAFGHSGQKCSATSLLICEAEVYDDPRFFEMLQDAAKSLAVGSAWDLQSFVTPLIRAPQGALLRGLTELEPGEQWLLAPSLDAGNPNLWTPGIKVGIRPGSFTHTTELFGPVLGVMRASDLEEAIRLANATPYGLTAGLQSLDENEQRRWIARMQAGNLYINRTTTGALVGRQPFGGCKASSFGPGAKAGGPSYVAELVTPVEARPRLHAALKNPVVESLLGLVQGELEPAEHKLLRSACRDYAWAHKHHYRAEHQAPAVVGQVNVWRYVDLGLLLRVGPDALALSTALALAAALTCRDHVTVSAEPLAAQRMPWLGRAAGVTLRVETATELAERLPSSVYGVTDRSDAEPLLERIRCVGGREPELVLGAPQAGIHLAHGAPMLHGRWELRHYLREQSVCIDYHRYGNLSAEALLPLGGAPMSVASPELEVEPQGRKAG
jgi:RHH-type proline utilization regulon transcriptional repressor/proline dehydrogenase/delta 1-pyrroline-5-carboxylate dehydrogenase